MNPFLFMHLIFLGLWGGIVFVEMILEFTLRNNGDQKNLIAQLHYRIDLFAEIPILLGVLLSGLMLLELDKLSSVLYAAKVYAGLCPVIINFLCIIPVIKLTGKSYRMENRKTIFDNNKILT